MVYKWSIPKYPVEAQQAGEELERIQSKYGAVRAADIVRESEDEGAVLHPCFEWHNPTAAHKYRLHQAQEIVQNLAIVHITPREEPEMLRAFVSIVPAEQPRGYVTMATVLSHEEYTAQMLEDARRELAAFRQKYARLQELAGVLRAIDNALL